MDGRRRAPPPCGSGRDGDRFLLEELKRRADRICQHILCSDYPPVDVAIERSILREWCTEKIPDRLDLYEMVYESRFDRLIEQFGEDRPEAGRYS